MLDLFPVSTSFLSETAGDRDYSATVLFISGVFEITTHHTYPRTAISVMETVDHVFSVPITLEIRNIRSSEFDVAEWCLGKYTEDGWVCDGDLTAVDRSVYRTLLKSTGIFAIYYRIPESGVIVITEESKRKITAISILTVSYIVVFVPLFYVFWRLLRFRKKLEKAKALLELNVGDGEA